MESTKKIKAESHELSREEVKQIVITFFKGCSNRKCFSPHCRNYIGAKNLTELRDDSENNVSVVLDMIQRKELHIYCHQAHTVPSIAFNNIEKYFLVFSFSFLNVVNLDSHTRAEVFAKIKEIVDKSFSNESMTTKKQVIEILEEGISYELPSIFHVLDQKVKDIDFFESVCWFFVAFSFIFDIENFEHLNYIKKLLTKLSLPDIYSVEFKNEVQKPEFRLFVGRQNLEKIVENLQNLLALQIAEQGHATKFSSIHTPILRCILSSMAFVFQLNMLLPEGQQVPSREFINETLIADFDVKIHTLLYMKESFESMPNNYLARIVRGFPANDSLYYLTYPFLFPVETKVDSLHFESRLLQNLEVENSIMNFDNPLMFLLAGDSLYLELKLRRDNLLEDALNQLAGKGKGATLRRPLKIKFQGEPGVDEGGLTKEFFQLLTQQLFDPSFGMFLEKNERYIWFDSKSFECNINFELIGTLLGLALYNQTILPLKFPLSVYKKLKLASKDSFFVGDSIGLEDLKELEPETYTTLSNILKQDWTITETGITFSVTFDFYGSPVVHDLIPGGSDIEVTEHNKASFVERYVDWYFNESVQNQFEPFCRGFYNVLSKRTLALFTARDLFSAICGNESLDFQALKRTTKYEDYAETSETIAHFWQLLQNDFNLEQKKLFLKFLTGSDRAPLKGLGDIKMTITRFGPDSEHLPASHTCFNHLLLPDYKDYQKLRTKMLKALENSEGFGLF